jgi:hypothetical protein
LAVATGNRVAKQVLIDAGLLLALGSQDSGVSVFSDYSQFKFLKVEAAQLSLHADTGTVKDWGKPYDDSSLLTR